MLTNYSLTMQDDPGFQAELGFQEMTGQIAPVDRGYLDTLGRGVKTGARSLVQSTAATLGQLGSEKMQDVSEDMLRAERYRQDLTPPDSMLHRAVHTMGRGVEDLPTMALAAVGGHVAGMIGKAALGLGKGAGALSVAERARRIAQLTTLAKTGSTVGMGAAIGMRGLGNRMQELQDKGLAWSESVLPALLSVGAETAAERLIGIDDALAAHFRRNMVKKLGGAAAVAGKQGDKAMGLLVKTLTSPTSYARYSGRVAAGISSELAEEFTTLGTDALIDEIFTGEGSISMEDIGETAYQTFWRTLPRAVFAGMLSGGKHDIRRAELEKALTDEVTPEKKAAAYMKEADESLPPVEAAANVQKASAEMDAQMGAFEDLLATRFGGESARAIATQTRTIAENLAALDNRIQPTDILKDVQIAFEENRVDQKAWNEASAIPDQNARHRAQVRLVKDAINSMDGKLYKITDLARARQMKQDNDAREKEIFGGETTEQLAQRVQIKAPLAEGDSRLYAPEVLDEDTYAALYARGVVEGVKIGKKTYTVRTRGVYERDGRILMVRPGDIVLTEAEGEAAPKMGDIRDIDLLTEQRRQFALEGADMDAGRRAYQQRQEQIAAGMEAGEMDREALKLVSPAERHMLMRLKQIPAQQRMAEDAAVLREMGVASPEDLDAARAEAQAQGQEQMDKFNERLAKTQAMQAEAAARQAAETPVPPAETALAQPTAWQQFQSSSEEAVASVTALQQELSDLDAEMETLASNSDATDQQKEELTARRAEATKRMETARKAAAKADAEAVLANPESTPRERTKARTRIAQWYEDARKALGRVLSDMETDPSLQAVHHVAVTTNNLRVEELRAERDMLVEMGSDPDALAKVDAEIANAEQMLERSRAEYEDAYGEAQDVKTIEQLTGQQAEAVPAPAEEAPAKPIVLKTIGDLADVWSSLPAVRQRSEEAGREIRKELQRTKEEGQRRIDQFNARRARAEEMQAQAAARQKTTGAPKDAESDRRVVLNEFDNLADVWDETPEGRRQSQEAGQQVRERWAQARNQIDKFKRRYGAWIEQRNRPPDTAETPLTPIEQEIAKRVVAEQLEFDLGELDKGRMSRDTSVRAFYDPARKAMHFFNNATADDVVHEMFHHMTMTGLMPSPLMDAMARHYGVGAGERWTVAMDERIVQDFLRYIRSRQLPEGARPELVQAFNHMREVMGATVGSMAGQFNNETLAAFDAMFGFEPDAEVADAAVALRDRMQQVAEIEGGEGLDTIGNQIEGMGLDVEGLEGVRMSMQPVTPQEDAEYLAAVASGDTETQQRLVDQAAKKAGYTVGPVYHGTNADFTAFDDAFTAEAIDTGFWFSDSKYIADTYGDRSIKAYLKLDNVKRVDFGGEKWDRHENGSTRAQTEGLFTSGLDGMVFENVVDANVDDWAAPESTVYVVVEPEYIKSADPVTYDDAGNPIPLSERFNPKSDDIRFSEARVVTQEQITETWLPRVRAAFPQSEVSLTRINYTDTTRAGIAVALPDGGTVLVEPGRDRIIFDAEKVSKDYGKRITQDDTAIGKHIATRPGISILLLSKKADDGVLAHEQFHALFNLAYNEQQKQDILERFGSEEKAAEAFRRKQTGASGLTDAIKGTIEKLRTAVGGDVFDGVRFSEVRVVTPQEEQQFRELTKTWTPGGDWQAWKRDHPAEYAEFEKMRAEVLKAQGYTVESVGTEVAPDNASVPNVNWNASDVQAGRWTQDSVAKFLDVPSDDAVYRAWISLGDLRANRVEKEDAALLRAGKQQPNEFAMEQAREMLDEWGSLEGQPHDASFDHQEWRDHLPWAWGEGYDESDILDLAREIEARESAESYDESEYHMERGGFPPIVVTRRTDGSMVVNDGNHRVDIWQQAGHDVAPAWVNDERMRQSAEVAPDDTGRIPPPSEWGDAGTGDIRFSLQDDIIDQARKDRLKTVRGQAIKIHMQKLGLSRKDALQSIRDMALQMFPDLKPDPEGHVITRMTDDQQRQFFPLLKRYEDTLHSDQIREIALSHYGKEFSRLDSDQQQHVKSIHAARVSVGKDINLTEQEVINAQEIAEEVAVQSGQLTDEVMSKPNAAVGSVPAHHGTAGASRAMNTVRAYMHRFKEFRRGVFNQILLGTRSPDDLMVALSDNNPNSVFLKMKKTYDGTEKERIIMDRRSTEFLNAALERHGLEGEKLQTSVLTPVVVAGNAMLKEEAMTIALYTRGDTTKNSLGGYASEQTQALFASNGYDLTGTEDTAEFDKVIEDAWRVSREDAKVAGLMDAIDEYNAWILKEVNASRSMRGEEPVREVKNYFAIIREHGLFADEDRMGGIMGLTPATMDPHLRPDARTLARTLAKGNRISLRGLTTFNAYRRQAVQYIAKEGQMRALKQIIRNAMPAFSRKGLQDEAQMLYDLFDMERFYHGRNTPMSPEELAVKVFTGSFKQAIFGLNAPSAVKQTFSLPTAAALLPLQDSLRLIANMTSVVSYGYSRGIKGMPNILRGHHYWEKMIEMGSAHTQSQYIEAEANRESGRRGFLGATIRGVPLKDWMLMPQRHGDMFTRVAAWGTAYDSKMRELSNRDDLTQKQMEEQAFEFAEDLVNQSQPAAAYAGRAKFQRSNEFIRALTPFTGQLTRNWNIANRHLYQPMRRAWAQGYKLGGAAGAMGEVLQVMLGSERVVRQYGTAQGAGHVFFFTYAMPALALSILARGRPPEDFEELMGDLFAYNIAALPYVGPPISSSLVFDRAPEGTPIYMNVVKESANVMRAIKNRETADGWVAGLKAAALGTGAPLRFVRFYEKLLKDEFTDQYDEMDMKKAFTWALLGEGPSDVVGEEE